MPIMFSRLSCKCLLTEQKMVDLSSRPNPPRRAPRPLRQQTQPTRTEDESGGHEELGGGGADVLARSLLEQLLAPSSRTAPPPKGADARVGSSGAGAGDDGTGKQVASAAGPGAGARAAGAPGRGGEASLVRGLGPESLAALMRLQVWWCHVVG